MSEQYYAAMTRPNIHIHSSHIEKIVDSTIYTKNGEKEKFDVSLPAFHLAWVFHSKNKVKAR